MVDININLKVSGHEKLVDYVASGIGATAGPLFATWRASQEAKARVIAARADVEVWQIQAAAESSTSQLIAKEQAKARKYVATSDELESGGHVRIGSNDVQKAMEFQAKKRLMNVGAIAGHAAEELKDKAVPDQDPNPDWTARFFDGAQDVSSEELQKLWGKILAGEVKSPGQTSLRTLAILRNMTYQEAKNFSDLMCFRIDTFIFTEGLGKMMDGRSNLMSQMIHFSHIGLLGGFGAIQKIALGDDGKWRADHCGHVLIIEGLPGQRLELLLTSINTSLITLAGLELAKLCQHEPDFQYLSYFAGLLAERNCQLKIAKIVDKYSKNFRVSDVRIIKPFAEPQERNQQEINNAE